MKNRSKQLMFVIVTLMAVMPVCAEIIDTRIGTLEFDGGYPTEPTVKKAYEQLDIQRATQAYLEFMPMMSVNSIFEAHIRDYGWKTPSDIQIYEQQDKLKDAVKVYTKAAGNKKMPEYQKHSFLLIINQIQGK